MIGRYAYAFAIISSFLLVSSSGGRNDRRAGVHGMEATCSECHQNSSGNGMVKLLGIPESIKSDSTYQLQLVVEDPSAIEAGFQIAAVNPDAFESIGTFIEAVNSRTIPGGSAAGRLTHSSPKLFENGQAIFGFEWQAPSLVDDQIIFYFASVAANDNGANTGDMVYLGNSGALLSSQDNVSFNHHIKHYPNPLTHATPLYVSTETEALTKPLNILIFNSLGQQVYSNIIVHRVLQIDELKQGVYMSIIKTGNRIITTEKIIVL